MCAKLSRTNILECFSPKFKNSRVFTVVWARAVNLAKDEIRQLKARLAQGAIARAEPTPTSTHDKRAACSWANQVQTKQLHPLPPDLTRQDASTANFGSRKGCRGFSG